MNNLDGKNLNDFKQWRCSKNREHVLGVTERVKVNFQANGSSLRYFTTRLMIFREAVDLSAEIPTEINVAGTIDGKMLSMVWKCSVAGCGSLKEWHPDEELVEYLVKTYLAE